jgi:hypothetical protein
MIDINAIIMFTVGIVTAYLFVIWAYAFMWKKLITEFSELKEKFDVIERDYNQFRKEFNELKYAMQQTIPSKQLKEIKPSQYPGKW